MNAQEEAKNAQNAFKILKNLNKLWNCVQSAPSFQV